MGQILQWLPTLNGRRKIRLKTREVSSGPKVQPYVSPGHRPGKYRTNGRSGRRSSPKTSVSQSSGLDLRPVNSTASCSGEHERRFWIDSSPPLKTSVFWMQRLAQDLQMVGSWTRLRHSLPSIFYPAIKPANGRTPFSRWSGLGRGIGLRIVIL